MPKVVEMEKLSPGRYMGKLDTGEVVKLAFERVSNMYVGSVNGETVLSTSPKSKGKPKLFDSVKSFQNYFEAPEKKSDQGSLEEFLTGRDGLQNEEAQRGRENHLRELGVTLPQPSAPVAAYVPCVQTGSLVFVSGQLPRRDGVVLHPGKLGADRTLDQGQEAARAAAINALAALKAEIGSLDRVSRIVRLNGFVASSPDFQDHSKVIDGASTILQQVFGEAGKHSRVAVGVPSLPLNAPVEIDLIVEIEPDA